ncbi:MAG TPA: sigma-70 family RNA polymerase sigma factor [Vicinamibacterales bacterium]|nr:sigma-70 family RNA polymerase sigma factor [Vicinamibacterales bacterium]
MKDEHLFLTNLPVIDAAVAHVCRRHRLTAAEADDFSAEVRLHFIERNYEPLRRFEGRSSLRTYLIVVVNHLFLDYRNRLWGKWRPSAEAARLGPAAILFEKFVVRDGWNVEQATEMLRMHHGIEAGDTLATLRLKIAERQPTREMVSEVEAARVESDAPAPDANVVRAEQGFLARRVQAALDRARQSLPAEERLILRMRFEDALPVADIARALHLNQKRLYRTIERLLATLRQRLEADGISKDEIAALFASGALDEHGDDPRSGNDPQSGTGSPAPAALGLGGRRG